MLWCSLWGHLGFEGMQQLLWCGTLVQEVLHHLLQLTVYAMDTGRRVRSSTHINTNHLPLSSLHTHVTEALKSIGEVTAFRVHDGVGILNNYLCLCIRSCVYVHGA